MKAPQVDVSYHDLNSLNELRQMAGKDKVGAIRQAAKQFESVFMGMLLSSMRKASAPMEEGNPLNSNATGFFRDMYDNQLATHLSQSGSLGLADLMVRQLAPETVKGNVIAPRPNHQLQPSDAKSFAVQPAAKALKMPQQQHFQLDPERIVLPARSLQQQVGASQSMPLAPTHAVAAVSADLNATSTGQLQKTNIVRQLGQETVWQAKPPGPLIPQPTVSQPASAIAPAASGLSPAVTPGTAAPDLDDLAGLSGPEADFVRQLLPSARQAAKQLGLEPLALIAQAALETGWGQKLFKGKDGQSSHNLFGIKAGSQWDGQVAVVDTLEYRGGLAQKEKARFRVYQDFAASMQDYVNLLKNQPRYQDAIAVSHDTSAYFRRLQAAGYATDPNYAEKILDVLQSSVFKQVRNLLGDPSNAANIAQGGRE
jgi:flagellar protein FlgJ